MIVKCCICKINDVEDEFDCRCRECYIKHLERLCCKHSESLYYYIDELKRLRENNNNLE